MTIAITGTTGQLGRLILAEVRKRRPDETIVALARTPEKAPDVGGEVRRFDYDDAESLTPALRGVDTLMLVSSSAVGQRERQHGNVVAGAVAAGVKHIVYTSLLHADTSPLPLAPEHRVTETMVHNSGIAYTILRNGWYTENYAGSIPPALAHGAFIGSAGNGRIASAARIDYAEAAALVLTDTGHAGQTYELAGDAPYTLADLAAEVSRQAGRDIPYVDMPEADYAAALTAAGLPEPLARMLANCDALAADGALFDDGRQLSRLIGRPTTPLSATVAEVLSRSA